MKNEIKVLKAEFDGLESVIMTERTEKHNYVVDI